MLDPNAASFTPSGKASRGKKKSKTRRPKEGRGELSLAFEGGVKRSQQGGDSNSNSNANHLLNFKYETRSKASSSGSRSSRGSHRPRRRHIKYDKDLFVQANYRFLVSDAVEVEKYSTNPDKMINWEDVAHVYSISAETECLQCPICLEEALVAQTTTCGHTFCLPCILRHAMTKGGREDISCPLCFGPTSLLDLRSLHHNVVEPLKVGSKMKFRKLRRKKKSIFPGLGLDVPPRAKHGKCFPFSKFTLTSEHGYESSMKKQVALLENYANKLVVEEGLGEGTLPFIFLSVNLLQERYLTWKEKRNAKLGSGDTEFSGLSLENMHDLAKIRAGEAEETARQAKKDSLLWPVLVSNAANFAEERQIEQLQKYEEKEVWELEGKEERVSQMDLEESDQFYSYYQSQDGQNVFIHPLNMKCILHHYGGDLTQAPACIEGEVVEIESFVQTEEKRNRFRFLSHLPIASTVTLCELDLGQSLPKSALKPFLDEINNRKRVRKNKKKRVARERTAAESKQREEKMDAEFFRMRLSSSPGGGDDEAHHRGRDGFAADLSSSPATQESGISFAKVTQLGFGAGSESSGNASWGPGSWGSPSQSRPMASAKWEKQKKHGKNVMVMKF